MLDTAVTTGSPLQPLTFSASPKNTPDTTPQDPWGLGNTSASPREQLQTQALASSLFPPLNKASQSAALFATFSHQWPTRGVTHGVLTHLNPVPGTAAICHHTATFKPTPDSFVGHTIPSVTEPTFFSENPSIAHFAAACPLHTPQFTFSALMTNLSDTSLDGKCDDDMKSRRLHSTGSVEDGDVLFLSPSGFTTPPVGKYSSASPPGGKYSSASPPGGDGARVLVLTPHLVRSTGLMSVKAVLVLCLWYAFSFTSLFLNKYIIDALNADVVFFTIVHISVAAGLGYLNLYCPCYMFEPLKRDAVHRPSIFNRYMLALGIVRVVVVLLGLLSLKYVAVSFMETVKSSAPLFTVLISFIVIKERNGLLVQLSLVPIMVGLVLCSAYELSFTWIGFLAVNGANLAECLKFVMSKSSLSGDLHKMSPAEFQFNTCGAGLAVLVPVYLLATDLADMVSGTKLQTVLIMVLNGVLFHFQTMMAWVLMEFLSPVTHSVCNTVKCALALWISVPIFGNHVTLLSGVGSVIVLFGVLLYNRARRHERRRLICPSALSAGSSALSGSADGAEESLEKIVLRMVAHEASGTAK